MEAQLTRTIRHQGRHVGLDINRPSHGRREGAALGEAYRSWEHKEAIEAFLTKRPADFQKQPPTPVS